MDGKPTVMLCLLLTYVFSLFHVSTGHRGPTSSQIQAMSGTDDMDQYRNLTPRPITPEEVNCHLELQQTLVLGGRCVPLGRGRVTWSCQSGIYIYPNSRECLELNSRSVTTATGIQNDYQQQQTRTTRRGPRRNRPTPRTLPANRTWIASRTSSANRTSFASRTSSANP